MEANLTPVQARPFRVGVFATVEQADKAVDELLKAGFSTKQITVVCSDAVKERHFSQLRHEEPAGTYTPAAAVAGGAIGAVLGGLASVVAIVGTGGIGVILAGPLFAGAGAIVGGLVGAMTTRGVERELANYYDQAVVQGKILIAVEDHSGNPQQLIVAERALAQVGAEPVPLPEG